MNTQNARVSQVQSLKSRLSEFRDVPNKLIYLDELAAEYVFTDFQLAQTVLAEQKHLLETFPHPDHFLNFHLNSAFIFNQLDTYQQAEEHFKAAIEILEDRGDIHQLVGAYIENAGTQINLGHLQEATELLVRAEQLLESFPDGRLRARLITREGFLNLHINDLDKAIDLLLEADKILTHPEAKPNLKDYYYLTLIHSALGSVYERLHENKKAVDSFTHVLEICQNNLMQTRISWHHLNVGKALMKTKAFPRAQTCFRKAIELTDDMSSPVRGSALANWGFCQFQQGHHDEALRLYSAATKAYKATKEKHLSDLSKIEYFRALVNKKLGEQRKATTHFIKAFEFAKLAKDYQQLSVLCEELAAHYAESGNFKDAYSFQTLHSEMEQQYQGEVNQKKIMELEVKYETDKRKREAELLRVEANSLQLRALRAQMDPHFMFNALNSIQGLISSGRSDEAEKYLVKFSGLIRKSLEFSDFEVITLEKEIQFLEEYLELQTKLRFRGSIQYRIDVDDEIEEDIYEVPTMIIQPYVENAIEHGLRMKDDGILLIRFSQKDENMIVCSVEDNGVGRAVAAENKLKDPRRKNHRSRGTEITERRLALIGRSKNGKDFVSTIDLKSEEGQPTGTRVEILIPIIGIKISV